MTADHEDERTGQRVSRGLIRGGNKVGRGPRWYPFWHAICRGLYYHRVEVVGTAPTGPALFVGCHRNGAVDGFLYRAGIPNVEYMIAAQLRKNLLARMFFAGIEIVRASDRPKEGTGSGQSNASAMQGCVDHLREGRLFVFPEGTSNLGHQQLRFRKGALRIYLDALEQGVPPVPIVPVGIVYEAASEFRSNVQVIIGEPIDATLPDDADYDTRLGLLFERMSTRLKTLGVNVDSPEEHTLIKSLAYASTLGTDHGYFQSLKRFEAEVPEALRADWTALQETEEGRAARRHQGIPLMPIGSILPYLAALLFLGPWTLSAALLNILPLAAGAAAARKMADGPNVIALWRMLIGLPLFFVNAALMTTVLLVVAPWSALGYWVVTGIGLWAWYRVKKVSVAVSNGIRYPALKSRLMALHTRVLEALS